MNVQPAWSGFFSPLLRGFKRRLFSLDPRFGPNFVAWWPISDNLPGTFYILRGSRSLFLLYRDTEERPVAIRASGVAFYQGLPVKVFTPGKVTVPSRLNSLLLRISARHRALRAVSSLLDSLEHLLHFSGPSFARIATRLRVFLVR